ncbi:amino acid carrier protein, partial [Sellimonas intestinalis]|nr:amino acid carrier protein [Sellimonas intestinalis]
IIAILGSATGFIESTLAQIYKVPREGGGYRGGPAYYIKNVLGNKPMAALFAVLISVTFGLIFNSVQANTITISLQAAFGLDRFVMGCIIAALTGIVIFGGVARIAKVAEWMVPIMAGLYLLIALGVTLMNIEKLPQVFNAIFSSAFDLQAVAGGGMGAALMTGIKRGLFSNEAGMGSVPNAAATASASHPVKQGLIQAFGVFVDTLLVCSASAFIVLLSDGYTEGKLTGIELVQQSLSQHLGPWAPSFLAGMICLFAFSSIVGNYYYGEINIGFISKNYMTLMLFRVFVVGMVLFGSVAKVALVWDLADLFMALMAITNLVAIAILGKYAYIALHDYMDQKRAGIVEPEFDPAILPSQRGIEVWKKK